MTFELWGIRIESVGEHEIRELEEAKAVLEKHGLRAIRATADKSKKRASALKANEAKTAKTREKLQNGLNLWRMEGDQNKELTPYRLGKLAEVSPKTAKKFLEEIKAL